MSSVDRIKIWNEALDDAIQYMRDHFVMPEVVVKMIGSRKLSQIVPEQELPTIDVTDTCYEEIRKKLVALGRGGTIIERGGGLGRCIICGDFVIRTGYVPRHR